KHIEQRILGLALSLSSWTARQVSASSILRFRPINNSSTSQMQSRLSSRKHVRPAEPNGANRIHEVARTAAAKHTIGNAALPKLALYVEKRCPLRLGRQ